MKSRLHFVSKLLMLMILFSFTMYCTSAQSSTLTEAQLKSGDYVSYDKDLYPIMQRSCTPCHFPERGRKQMLDSYDNTKDFIKDIIARISLPEDNDKYMPFKKKRQGLSSDEVQLFKTWLAQGMMEK